MIRFQYFGYIVNDHGVHGDATKIQSIRDWTAPTTLTDMCSFLGLVIVYRRFMVGLSHIAWALTQVTRGSVKAKFLWDKSQLKEF